MRYLIKELRNMTGMTQKEFSKKYDIPISTLRKWEQGESSPASYIINLIAHTIPETDDLMRKIKTEEGVVYYYDKFNRTISDAKGNKIYVQENLDDVKEQNLHLYITDMFHDFYEIQDRFNRDCRYDKEEDIIWS